MIYDILYFLPPLLFELCVGIYNFKYVRTQSFYKLSTYSVHGSLIILLLIGYIEYLISGVSNQFISVLGIIISVIGLSIGITSMSILGKNFATHIQIKKGHKLIKISLYKYCRHPIYFGALLLALGTLLFANSYYTIILELVIALPIVLNKIYLEEKVLVKHFGDEYKKYKKMVPMLLPS